MDKSITPVNHWLSATGILPRLPRMGELVTIRTPRGEALAARVKDDDGWCWEGVQSTPGGPLCMSWPREAVTHWQPLPDAQEPLSEESNR